MSSTRWSTIALGVMAMVAGSPALAQTPEWTDWGSIRELEAGWTEDSMAVRHSAPIRNPGGCPVSDSYATNPNDPGHTLFHTVLLDAFIYGKQVHLLIAGCVYSKPHIIAVGVH
jgi:hypothetical protein